jgi:hypothetical protein
MMDRQTTLLWMKDLIEHMRECHDRLQWTSDGPAEAFLTEALVVDLTECRRLCDELRTKSKRPAKRSDRRLETLGVPAKG